MICIFFLYGYCLLIIIFIMELHYYKEFLLIKKYYKNTRSFISNLTNKLSHKSSLI